MRAKTAALIGTPPRNQTGNRKSRRAADAQKRKKVQRKTTAAANLAMQAGERFGLDFALESIELRQLGPGAKHVGREQTFKALDQTWHTARIDRGIWREFSAFAKAILPDPIDLSLRMLEGIKPVKETERERMRIGDGGMEEALSFQSVMSPRVLALLSTTEGSAYMMYLMLKPYHPEVTEDIAWDIVMAIGERTAGAFFALAQGILPKKLLAPA